MDSLGNAVNETEFNEVNSVKVEIGNGAPESSLFRKRRKRRSEMEVCSHGCICVGTKIYAPRIKIK
jgi:hypothetical protein